MRGGTIGTIQYHRSHDCSSRSCRMEPFVELNISIARRNHSIAAVDLVEWSHYVRGGTIPSKPPKREPCDCSSCSCRMEPFVELNCAEEPSHQSHQNRTIRLQLLICSNGTTTCVEEPCDCSRCSFLSNVAFTQSAGKQQSPKKVMRLVFILATDDGQRKWLYQFYCTHNKSHTCSF